MKVPDTIPVNVELAVFEVLSAANIDKFLSSLDPRVQAYNEAWEILPSKKASQASLDIVEKAKVISVSNGWDWDAIVAKIEQRYGDGLDRTVLPTLLNLQEKLKINDISWQQWSDANILASLASQLKQEKKAVYTVETKTDTDNIGEKLFDQAMSILANVTEESKDRIKSNLPKTKKRKQELVVELSLISGIGINGARNLSILTKAVDEWLETLVQDVCS